MTAAELNAYLKAGRAAVWAHEEALVDELEALLRKVGAEAAERFEQKVTRFSLDASAGVTPAMTMIAVYPSPEQQRALAGREEGAQDAATIHCTLSFLGELTEAQYETLVAAVRTSVGSYTGGVLEGVVGGVACFAKGPEGHPSILLPDVKGLAELRHHVVTAAEQAGFSSPSEHGWTPHLTHSYSPTPTPPSASYLGKPLTFDRVSVTRGDVMRTDITLDSGVMVITAGGGVRIVDGKVVLPEWTGPPADEVLDSTKLASTIDNAIGGARESAVSAFGAAMPTCLATGHGDVTLRAENGRAIPAFNASSAITDGPAMEYLDKRQADWGKALTPEQFQAIKRWQNIDGYKEINAYLREGKDVSEPPLAEGHTRLYRGEGEGFMSLEDQGLLPDSDTTSYFTSDRGFASGYDTGGGLYYVDVPDSVLAENASWGADGVYELPGDIAAEATAVPTSLSETVADLDAALAKAPTIGKDANTFVYRGVAQLRDVIGEKVERGVVFTDEGYVSATTEESIAWDYANAYDPSPAKEWAGGIIKVELPPGAQGGWLRGAGAEPMKSAYYSQNENRELVLPRGQQYVVTDVGRDPDANMPVVTVRPLDLGAITAAGGGCGPGEVQLKWDVTSPFYKGILSRTGEHIGAISDNVRADVMRVIDRAYTDGLSVRDTGSLIRETMEGTSRGWAETIARTELNRVANGASLDATKTVDGLLGGGQFLKEWMTAPGAPHPRHELDVGLDGQTVELDAPFNVNGEMLMFPGDPDGDPGETINCFPATTRVAGEGVESAFRRHYDGDLVRVEALGGHVLAGTPNHPVLTMSGWKPLAALREGDYLVCARLAQLPSAVAPEVDDAPPMIHEVFGALARVGAARRVAGRAVQFHGDATDAEVEVVSADGSLSFGLHAELRDPALEPLLVGAGEVRGALPATRPLREVVLSASLASDGVVSRSRQSRAFGGGELAHSREHRPGSVATLDPERFEASLDGGATDAVQLGERLLGHAFEVSAAKVAKVDRYAFAGDVFNLQTRSGAYVANGVIAHNCRCTLVYVDAQGDETMAEEDLSLSGAAEAAEVASPQADMEVPMGTEADTETLASTDGMGPCTCEHSYDTHEGDGGACSMDDCSCSKYDEADAVVADGMDVTPPEQPIVTGGAIRWQAVLLPEGKATDDGRIFAPGSIKWRDVPLTLMGLIVTEPEGHQGAEVCGRIDRIWRDDSVSPNLIRAEGIFDEGEFGSEVARMVGDEVLRGNSVDVAIKEYEIGVRSAYVDEDGMWIAGDDVEGPALEDMLFGDEPLILAVRDAVIGMSTVCPFPAFEEGQISVMASGDETHDVAVTLDVTTLRWHVWIGDSFELVEGLTAAAAGMVPETPPAAWFENPEFDEPTPITITDDGRVFGHAWTWDTCHIGLPGCTTAPHSITDYAFFHLKECQVENEDGTTATVEVGTITLDAPHAPQLASRKEATAHYDNTGCAVADIRVGEDEHGGWVAGALRPDASAATVRKLRGAVLSGDWRKQRGNLELVGLLAVNIPGFPVPRARASVMASASGEAEVVSLVAAGINHVTVTSADKHRFAALSARASGGMEALAALASGSTAEEEDCGCGS